MAEAIVDEVGDFASSLYGYLWSKHKFKTQSLEDIFTEQLNLENSQPAMQESNFNEDIGKAVLCSQYMLRELCYYFFSHPEKGIGKTADELNSSLSIIIVNWTCNRDNQFVIFIDTCAIIAEAILFLDAKSQSPRNPFEAVKLFKFFFECDLSYEFFEIGGWKQLQEVAREKYSYINSILEPALSKATVAYEFPTHNCQFVKRLMNSPVFFPVPKSKVCRYCMEQLDDPSLHYFDVLELYEESCFTAEDEDCESMEIDSGRTSVSTDETNEEIEALSKSFLCLFVGKMKVSKVSQAEKIRVRLRNRINLKRKMSLEDRSIKRKLTTPIGQT